MLEIDNQVVEKVLLRFIRDSVHKNGFKNAILGVSGGLDSAVVLTLTQRALGSEFTFALLMPYKLSAASSLTHGRLMCERLGLDDEVIDISPCIDAYFDRYPSGERVLIGNKCARERMAVLYDFSVRKKALVVGTSNKSELLVGYSTIFGDSAAAFLPLGDLYKSQVFDLARYLGIPQEIIDKKPSADLWPEQTDEGEIGISYQELDEILYRLVDRRERPDELEKNGYKRETIDRIIGLVVNSQYKRTMPPVAKMQNRAPGIDFRYPRDWNK